MSCYSLPAMSCQSEFFDLEFVAGYVDRLVKSTGDMDYAVVYEWDEDGPDSGRPPLAVLLRIAGAWERRGVLVTSQAERGGDLVFTCEVDNSVNSH